MFQNEQPESEYAPAILAAVQEHFPALLDDLTEYGWLWVLAQAWQESRFDPVAVSAAGAIGIMQLMPGTALELGVDPRNPRQNITGGVRYLSRQYQRMGEIPNYRERLRFALASYNGGRGWINRALELARAAEGFPGDFSHWRRSGSPPGFWQMWEVARLYLKDPACVNDKGQHPDWRQIWDYVHRIEARLSQYLDAACVARKHPAWG